MNQTELIVALKEGNDKAFKILIKDWQDMVYNTALGFVQNEDDADEITQEVFIQVYQSIRSFNNEAKISTWLYKITITKALDFLKKQRTKKRFGFVQQLFGNTLSEANEIKEFHHPGVVMEKKEMATELFKAMQQLPDNQRTAFVLHKLEAQKYVEVAEIMNLSLQAVESLIARAKVNLKKTLQEYYIKNIA